MGIPYPQWMSGIAIERPTMPGIVATFATCSGAKSFFTCSIIFASAKIRPSVRIAGLYDLGIRYRGRTSFSVGPCHCSAIGNQETMWAVAISVFGAQYSPRVPSDRAFRSLGWETQD